MPASIPEKFIDLFSKRAFANLATVMPNGHPQVTPVWCDLEDGCVLINTARGRQKDRNIKRDPHVSVAISDPDNPYRYLEVRGQAEEVDAGPVADQHIDKMAKKYLGMDRYPNRQAGEVRVLYRVRPEHTSSMG
ncbi:MAG TPA: PPOX class F420-dependent oxidoreductase [Terriglobia bacterium]|nr:PPOX class F420-dependent oxidoreductase [Terriglobia bacterium]